MSRITDDSGEGRPGNDRPPARRRHLWLLVLPFLWQVAAVPWANGVAWTILSLPFLLVWQMAGVPFASAVIALVHVIDNRIDRGTAGGGE